jgi:hypothetical protein
MKTLTELYTSILSSAGLVVDNQGFVSTLLPGSDTPKPFSVDAKRLVLPIPEQLKQTDWSNRIGFHPGLQSLTGGESRVMEKFRDRMNGYADFMFGMLLSDIAQLGVNEELHKDLTPVQADVGKQHAEHEVGVTVHTVTELFHDTALATGKALQARVEADTIRPVRLLELFRDRKHKTLGIDGERFRRIATGQQGADETLVINNQASARKNAGIQLGECLHLEPLFKIDGKKGMVFTTPSFYFI